MHIWREHYIMRNFIIVLFTKNYSGDQIRDDEMGRTCSTHKRNEKLAEKI
jgi:hypothetical protein